MARPKAEAGSHKKVYEINGEVKTLGEWAKQYGVIRTTVHDRMKRGMTLQEALTTPLHTVSKPRINYNKMYRVCAKCRWSEVDGARHLCMYIVNHRPPQRRPVSAMDCTEKKSGSVFEPRRKGQLTPAQLEAFRTRGYR